MPYIHILLEVYCGYKHGKKKKIPIPQFCKNGIDNPGYDCFKNQCQFVSYTECPNEFCFAGELGEVHDQESYIGFGGEMEPDSCDEEDRKRLILLWQQICKKKIQEAYEEYMKAQREDDADQACT